MLAEVLIYVPSIANFRSQWLKDRIAQAPDRRPRRRRRPDRILSSDLAQRDPEGAGVLMVSPDARARCASLLRTDTDPMIDASFDLREEQWLPAIIDAFAALLRTRRARHRRHRSAAQHVRRLHRDRARRGALREAMLRYGINILLLSLIISLIVAVLVFAALNVVLVRPSAAHPQHDGLRAHPEDRSRIIKPSGRR